MRTIGASVLSMLVLSAIASRAGAADVQVTLHDGRVSMVANNATVGDILTEWAKVGRIKIDNLAVAPREIVTIRLQDVTEQQALATVLRRAGGYIAERRASADTGSSSFERILVMAVSVPARPVKTVAAAPPSDAVSTAPGDASQADGEQQLSSMAQARAEQIAAARGQSVADDTADQQTGEQAAQGQTTAVGQVPARDTSAIRPATDPQPPVPLPVDIDVPVNPGTVEDIPPQDPRAQDLFKGRRALETVDPRKVTLPKSLSAPPKQPGGR